MKKEHKDIFYWIWQVMFVVSYPFMVVFSAVFAGIIITFSGLSNFLVRVLKRG